MLLLLVLHFAFGCILSLLLLLALPCLPEEDAEAAAVAAADGKESPGMPKSPRPSLLLLRRLLISFCPALMIDQSDPSLSATCMAHADAGTCAVAVAARLVASV